MKTKVSLPRSVKKLFPNVDICIDATKSVFVSVSRKDCKGAEKLNPTSCAMAIAAKRELQVEGVIIGISTSYLIKGNKAIRFATPESVQREIISFDRHQDFAPGDYYLKPKPPSMKLGMASHPNRSKNKQAKRKVHGSARVRVLATGAESNKS